MNFQIRILLLKKPLKTLLINAKVSDVDFILCNVDGMPEPYMPKNYYLTKDSSDQAPLLSYARYVEPLSMNIVLIPDPFSFIQIYWQSNAKRK